MVCVISILIVDDDKLKPHIKDYDDDDDDDVDVDVPSAAWCELSRHLIAIKH